MKDAFKIISSPLQGYTDAVYRRLHRKYFGGVDNYYTPFLRIEKGGYRKRDLRDLAPENNDELTIPQILPANSDEFLRMVETLGELGWQECDLNFGCPFPMLSKRGKGSGMLAHIETLETIAKELIDFSKEMRFSIKMRLGYDCLEQGLECLEIFNNLDLKHIVCHSRLGIDKYTSPLRLDDFETFYNKCKQDLIYNGNVESLEIAQVFKERFPNIKGFALGRSLLTHPWLAKEIQQNSDNEMISSIIKEFHDDLFRCYSEKLEGGEHQLLNKLKTIWDYLLTDSFPKQIKKIQKSSSLNKYTMNVNEVFKTGKLFELITFLYIPFTF